MRKQIQTISKIIKQQFEFYFKQTKFLCVHFLFLNKNSSSRMHSKMNRRSFVRSSVLLVSIVFLSKCKICKCIDGQRSSSLRVTIMTSKNLRRKKPISPVTYSLSVAIDWFQFFKIDW